MAVTQTGSISTFSLTAANSQTVTSTLTVPADAELAVVGIFNFAQGNAGEVGSAAVTITKGGTSTAMTGIGNAGDGGLTGYGAGLFYLALPDTGSNKTITVDFGGSSGNADPGFLSVLFFKGNDTSSPVRDSDGVESSTAPAWTTPTLTAQSGDLIVALAGAYTGGTEGSVTTWSNLTELSELTATGNSDGAWATGSPSGNTTVGVTTASNWSLGSVVAIVIKPATAKTLTAGAGSYTVTGTAASLEYGREVVAGAGSYTLTGTDAALELGREVVAGAGSYTLTGTDASLEFGREVVAGAGSYTLSGTDATLTLNIPLAAGAGSYALSGADASLELGREVVAGAGSYSLTGTDANLELGREVVAGAGSYALTGADVALTIGAAGTFTLTADAGSYALSGTNASLEYGREVVAGAGSYALSGTDAELIYSSSGSATTSVGDWGGGERPRVKWPKARGLEQTQESIERRRREAREAKERLKAVEAKAEAVKAKIEQAQQIRARAKRGAAINRLAREQERVRLLLISTQERVVDAEAKLRQAEAMQLALHRMEEIDEEDALAVLSSVQWREEEAAAVAAARSALGVITNILREL